MGRLVLDNQDEGSSPTVFGITCAFSDIGLVFDLNFIFGWGLFRVSDIRCRHSSVITTHAIYRGIFSGSEISLFWNAPEFSEWALGERKTGGGLFSGEDEVAPKLLFLKNPKKIHALLTIDPELSQKEMLILRQKILKTTFVLNIIQLPWLSIRGRENLLFEPIKNKL